MSEMRLFGAYLNRLHSIAQQGDAREESFYPALAEMMKAFADSSGRQHIHVTTLPQPTDGGNPDMRLWNGKDRIVGYVEAKKPTENLDRIEDSEQLKRYRATFPNLILTNFLEFRLYRDGVRVESVLIGRPYVLTQLGTAPPLEKPAELSALLERFLDFSLPRSYTSESLAVELAKRTRMLRDVIALLLVQEEDATSPLKGFYEAFQKYLIGTLNVEGFADLFAQTVTYGLFAARTRTENGFNRRVAPDSIPRTIGVLRRLFRYLSQEDLPDQLAWCVDDIADVLAVADAHGILDRYYREGKGSDPIVHFYETFLARYDPAERERRGVYYTPEPVVGYIVRSLHGLLQSEFGEKDGLASEGVTLLDPAAGTMTFLARAAQVAVDEFESKYGSGASADFIRRHILKNFYGFELMMAPYAIGHLKMSFFLEELGYRLSGDERMPLYLTNTLDIEELDQTALPGLSALAEESRMASEVKKQKPILVILGNPPYSGHSANMGNWIRGLIDAYKIVDGKPLGEKNPKWLQDDYVKFLRFAQWKIEQAGRGVVGMITNHSYLDNPTFRGMRQSLMCSFDEIYLLDLHGNSLKKEICPDGSPDHNVFDIRQGVAIALFVKRGGRTKSDAVVRHAELYGLRQGKYDWLNAHDYTNTAWQELRSASPTYLFVPHNDELESSYRRFISLPKIFPENSVGIVTARDNLTIHWTADDAWRTVNAFSRMDPELARQGYNLGKDTQDWKISLAQRDLLDSGPNRTNVVPILYRPFDVRHTYYTGNSGGFICRPRPEVMRHMLARKNLALMFLRQVKTSPDWSHCFVVDRIAECCVISNRTSEIGYLSPLYLYPEPPQPEKKQPGRSRIIPMVLFETRVAYDGERKPNLNPALMEALTAAYDETPTPEDVFHYIYAVLYAPTYRTKYAEFLRMDFPRIPFTADLALFRRMAALGERLVGLHLLQSPDLDTPTCRYEGHGDMRVGKDRKTGLRYDSEAKRVYINATQHFAPVPEAVWMYQVGGYQVCEKWLRDRKERPLDSKEVRTYCRIVTALGRTLEIQGEIDALYPDAESSTIPLSL